MDVLNLYVVADRAVVQAAASERSTTVSPDNEQDLYDSDQPLDLSCKKPADVQSTSSLVASQHPHDRRTLELDFLSSHF